MAEGANLADLSPGDRVTLASDPCQEAGTVGEIIAGRVYVRWDRGRGWIYPSKWLVKLVA